MPNSNVFAPKTSLIMMSQTKYASFAMHQTSGLNLYQSVWLALLASSPTKRLEDVTALIPSLILMPRTSANLATPPGTKPLKLVLSVQRIKHGTLLPRSASAKVSSKLMLLVPALNAQLQTSGTSRTKHVFLALKVSPSIRPALFAAAPQRSPTLTLKTSV